MVEKVNLRKEYLEKRKNLSQSQYWYLNDLLLEGIKNIPWNGYQLVHVFMPISKHNEVDTFSILEYLKKEQPNLKIVLPRVNFDNLKMENVLFDPVHTILGRNKQDIPEPIHGKIIAPKDVDVVMMPLLAFDKIGNRVGYGKGFYDRFLTECRPNVNKIGLSLFDPVDEIMDINEFDIRMDRCVTPNKTWTF